MAVMTLIREAEPRRRESISERAYQAREAYRGRNIQLTSSGAVHYTVDSPWIDGHLVPVARCRSASGAGPMVGALPTNREVTCLRCMRGKPGFASSDDAVLAALFPVEAFR